MAKTPTGELSALAEYIKEILFKNWKRDRGPLERKWENNRNAFNAVAAGKWKIEEAEGWRSKTFLKLTKVKILAAYAMVVDILLQAGKIPFALVPSPWDKIRFEDMEESEQEPILDAIGDMKGLIDQQFLDCQADRALMLGVFSGAEYGETYGKWRVHDVERKGYRPVQMAPEGMEDPEGQYTRYERTSETITAPAWDYVSVWSVFRDLETDDLQAGVGIIQQDLVSKYDLRELKGKPFYIDSAIDKVIEEAVEEGGHQSDQPDKSSLPPFLRDIQHRNKTIERLEAWVRVPKTVVSTFFNQMQDGDAWNQDEYNPDDHDGNEIEIMCVVAGNEVIRFAPNTDGYRPYHRAEWEIKLDELGATGVADNLEDIQTIDNGIIRALEDNIKLQANVLLAIKEDMLAPGEDGSLKPGKKFKVSDEVDDVRKAIQQIVIQPISKELFQLLPIIERKADESTMLPRIIQGMVAEKQKPDTLGEMQILQQNAGKYLGSVIKNYDEGLTEPMAQQFYDYNMEDPGITKGKGNYIAKAMGFSSFQDKIVRGEALRRLLGMILSDDYLKQRYKTEKIAGEIAKTEDLDPDEFQKTDEELAEEQQAAMEMRAEEEAKVRQMGAEQLAMQTDADIAKEDAKHENELEKEAAEQDGDLELEQLEHEHELVEDEQEFAHELNMQRMQPQKQAVNQ